MVADLLAVHGFEPATGDAGRTDGERTFRLAATTEIPVPAHVTVVAS